MRRMVALLAAAAVALLPAAAPATTLTAHRGADWVNSFGANSHIGWGGGCARSYTNTAAIIQALDYLLPIGSIRHLRDGVPGNTTMLNTFIDLARNHGVVFQIVNSSNNAGGTSSVSNPQVLHPASDMATIGNFVNQQNGGMDGFEGPNEANTNYYSDPNIQSGANSHGSASWINAADQYFFNLLTSNRNSNANLANVKFIGVTTASASAAFVTSIGDVSNYVDVVSSHNYFGNGAQPQPNLSGGFTVAHSQTPAKPNIPMYFTETGYNTAYQEYNHVNGDGSKGGFSSGGDDTEHAKLVANMAADATFVGAARTFNYELLNNDWDPTCDTTDVEQMFGLFHVSTDGTQAFAKPGAVSLHNMFSLLWDASANATSFTPSSLTYTATNLPANSYAQAFQKANGDIYLMLWAEPQVWNSSSHTEVGNAGSTATITFPQSHTTLAVYDPVTNGTATLATATNATAINVSVVDHPVLVLVSANGAPVTGSAGICRIH